MPAQPKTSTQPVKPATPPKAVAPAKTVPAPVSSPVPAPESAQVRKQVKRESPAPAPVAPVTVVPVPVAPVPESGDAQVQPVGSVVDEFTRVLEVLANVSRQVKELTAQVKNLQRHVGREHRDLEKAAKSRRRKHQPSGVEGDKPKRAPSGFAKPTRLSKDLCRFLGLSEDTELARTEVTKKINLYVKEHNLQRGKQIMPDAKLTTLLNLSAGDELTYFNLQKYLKHHFQKADGTGGTGVSA